jgi:hypothetical protein
MVIRLRGFPPPVRVQSACRHRRRGLIVAPQSRLEHRDSCCRSAKAPKQLECSALEPPAICDEACADAPRLTLRHIGPLLLSLVVQGGAQPHVTIRILGNGVNVVQSSDCPDIDERVQRAIIAVSRASTPAPMDRCEWTPTLPGPVAPQPYNRRAFEKWPSSRRLPRICSTTSKDRLGLLRRFGGGPVNVGYRHQA